MESSERERVDEMVGGLDGHGHGGPEHRLRPHRARERLRMAPVQEGEDLLHDVVEDDPAAERRLRDGGDATRLVETPILQAKRILRPSLEAGDELLLEADGRVE